jgi:hypothetical protein
MFDWFWDGLNPFIVPAVAAVGLVAWRLWPPPPVAPLVSVKMRCDSGALRFTDPGQAVLSAPRVRCSLEPGPPILPGPLPILDIRTAR